MLAETVLNGKKVLITNSHEADIFVVFAKTDLTLEIGDAIRLYPTLYPSGATGKIVWSSSDDYVAVVNSSGLVVARNASFGKKGDRSNKKTTSKEGKK